MVDIIFVRDGVDDDRIRVRWVCQCGKKNKYSDTFRGSNPVNVARSSHFEHVRRLRHRGEIE